jgi:hypothetical protein
MFMSMSIEVKVSITSPNFRNFADLVEVVNAAESLKRALWGKDIDTVLRWTSDHAMRYVPEEQIKSLELDKINFHEKGGLLIRKEYEAALETEIFNCQKAMEAQSCGVTVIGQPGIGALFLLIIK